jgi:hypothetical protein
MKASKWTAPLLAAFLYVGCNDTGQQTSRELAPLMHRADKPDGAPLKLDPGEAVSLEHALPKSGPVKDHIHADAVDGHLVFSSESQPNAAHVSGSEPQISWGSGTPARVVATPGAAQLLEQRSK